MIAPISRRVLVGCFLAGLAVRVLLLTQTSHLGLEIADEHQYAELATSLVEGRGFAWANGQATSLRPPLYPGMVAGIWMTLGSHSLQVVRGVQIVISLLTCLVVYDLGRRVFTREVGQMAAVATWLYPSLIYVNFSILTETLFTAFLVVFVWLAMLLRDRPGPVVAVTCGVALGLGALTRSVLWPVPLIFCPLVVILLWRRGTLSALWLSALVFTGYAVVVSPWAIRNTRLQHVTTIVDTMGGMNLRMGNYEHTPEDRMWDAVSLTGDRNWVYALTQEPPGALPPGGVFTEGMKDKWAQRKAIEYIRTHPVTTVRRSLIKFGDFWGLERTFVAGWQQGLYAPPTWFAVAAGAAMVLSYVAIVLLGIGGMWLARPAWPAQLLLLLPVVVITGVHTLVFGHERYHLPLMPILAIYAAAFIAAWRPRALGAPWLARAGALVVMAALVIAWARQILITDAARLAAFVDRLW